MKDKDYGFKWIDLEKGDRYILNESSYTCLFDPSNKSSLLPDDVWLDVGANFGSFAVRISPLVDRVIAVEPEPNNVARLMEHIRLNELTNVDVIKAAAISGRTRPVPLALGHTFNYTHRVGHVRGRAEVEVQGININRLVNDNNVTKIKMDCEGSEHELMDELDYDPIQEIILEWHFTLIPDKDWTKMNAAIQKLRESGFKLLRAPIGRPTKRWTAIIWARKE